MRDIRYARPEAATSMSRKRTRSAPDPGPRDLVICCTDAALADAGALGGKATHLGGLSRAGLPVPAWICVTTRATSALVAAGLEAVGALEGVGAQELRPRSARARARIAEHTLPPPLLEALEGAMADVLGTDERFAVRSSVVGEDSAEDSFAGQMDTLLHVPRDDVPGAILDVVASAFSERALLYRQLRGVTTAPRVAVLVQRMIEPRASGVIFTANPTSGDRAQLVIAAGLGLGEGIVGDLVESDTLFVDRATLTVTVRAIEPKRTRVVFDSERRRGTHVAPVRPEAGDGPAITDATARALCELALRAERHFGAPQDLEWAEDAQGALVLLQSRPITTLGTGGRETVLDNANIVESYPGLSTPLTFSVARRLYGVIFTSTLRLAGMPEEVIARNHAMLDNLIALVDGRIYYNIGHWYGLYELVPGLDALLPAMEKALGLRKRFSPPRPEPSLGTRVSAVPAQAQLARALLRRFVTLEGDVARCLAAFATDVAAVRALDVDALDPHGLLDQIDALEAALGARYGVSPLNDLYAQQLYALSSNLLAAWLPDRPHLQHALFCGETGMDSVAPVESALRVASLVRADAALRARFEATTDARAAFGLLVEHPVVGPAARTHVRAYADRVLEEMKLETPTLEDDPSFFVQTLRNFVRSERDVSALVDHERQVRAEAEGELRRALRRRPDRQALLGLVLAGARRSVRYRENLRLARAQAFGAIKRLYRGLGRHLHRAGLLATPEAILMLTRDEVADTVRGASVTRDLDALGALRRREYASFGARTPAPRIVRHGIVYAGPFEETRTRGTVGDDGTLRGIGCSPGRARGPARVILDPSADLDVRGSVLVARTTDPGWVFLMVAAAGIVVEKGSLLSHTAIVGRELGIPTVVGVKDATSRLAEGAMLEIDGAAGTVTVLP